MILANVDKYRRLREERFGYSGLALEFKSIGQRIALDFGRTQSIAHKGQKGTVREDILREFLQKSGYLPKRYAITRSSAKVISWTGHGSGEVDLALYDGNNSPLLLSERSVQYLPEECVYAVIQIKSRLNASEFRKALENIASCKRLQKVGQKSQKSIANLMHYAVKRARIAGIVFAYALSDGFSLESAWTILKDFIAEHGPRCAPNMVCVLGQGILVPMSISSRRILFDSREMDGVSDLLYMIQQHGEQSLLIFYLRLIEMLSGMDLDPPEMTNYVDLKIPLGGHSWDFGEKEKCTPIHGKCDRHGDYFPALSASGADVLLEFAKTHPAENWIRVTDIAAGRPGDNHEAYKRQPFSVVVFDPDNLGWGECIYANGTSGGLTYIDLVLDGIAFWIPYRYTERLFDGCPRCSSTNESGGGQRRASSKREDE